MWGVILRWWRRERKKLYICGSPQLRLILMGGIRATTDQRPGFPYTSRPCPNQSSWRRFGKMVNHSGKLKHMVLKDIWNCRWASVWERMRWDWPGWKEMRREENV